MSNSKNQFSFNNIIFPHLNSSKKQRKEIPFIYCYNLRIVRQNKQDDKDYINYVTNLKKFINENKHLLVQWNDFSENNRFYKNYFSQDKDERSIYWDMKYIEPNDKLELDNFLEFTGYKKKVDKYGYVYEGCLNDDKIFIGGKNDLIKDYCRLFPNTTYCKNFKSKTQTDVIDKISKIILDDPKVLDDVADAWIKSFDSE
jgi:hypothetical protein